jgi:hypothetical protein
VSDGLLFLMLGCGFTGLLVWGLKSDVMPNKGMPIHRSDHPGLFWVGAVILAFAAVASFAAAIDTGLSNT